MLHREIYLDIVKVERKVCEVHLVVCGCETQCQCQPAALGMGRPALTQVQLSSVLVSI